MYGIYKPVLDCWNMQFVPSGRGWLQVRRVGADHSRIDVTGSMTPAFAANAMAFPDIPSRSESRLISCGIEIVAGNTVVPPSALVSVSAPDVAICP